MPIEHHHFELIDPLIRSVHIELHPDHAIIEYYINLPYLEPVQTKNITQTTFTAAYGNNLISIDVDNRDAHIVLKVEPEVAIHVIQTYDRIAVKHTVSVSDD